MPIRPPKRQKVDHEPDSSSPTRPPRDSPDMDDIPFRSVLVTSQASKKLTNIREQYNAFLDINVKYTIVYDGEVKGMAKWEELFEYQRFRLQDDPDNLITCRVGDIVYVQCEDDAQDWDDGGNHTTDAPIKSWVGQVLEIRAFDACHVFLRVWWLNRPEDMDDGRQSYHGEDEVIPTTRMDIIDANTVNGKVEGLKRIDEFADEDEMPMEDVELIWRQTYDIRDGSISPLRRYCICNDFKNPNLPLLGCENKECAVWLHLGCIKDDAAKRYYVWASKNNSKAESAPTNSPVKHGSMLNSLRSTFGLSSSPHPGPDQINVDLAQTSAASLEKARRRFTVSIENLDSKMKNEPVGLRVVDTEDSGIMVEPARCLKCRTVIR